MRQYDFDLFTIGAGSGGVRAARLAAGFGARVAVAEERHMGGTCVNAGCIPKKLFAIAAHYGEDFQDAAGYGWSAVRPSFDWPALIANKDREIARLNGVYEQILTSVGVRIFRSRATVADAHTVEVEGRRMTAAHILVATGGWPAVPAIPGAELAVTSNEAFHLPQLPRSIVLVGGGYVACEFASIFNGLGVETTLAYRGERLIREFDADLGTALAQEMAKKGVRIRFRANVAGIARQGDGLRCTLAEGTTIEAGAIMFATGRAPNTRGIGLEQAGVRLAANGAVIVDENLQSSVPSIHAIGDAIHRMQLTPVALAEGMVVADRLFNKAARRMDYANVPTAIFSNPNVGSVGLSEAAARERHGDVAIYRTEFIALRHRLTGRNERVLMKLVVDKASDRVLGVHMVGPDAGETIQGFAVALQCGATKAQFDATIGIHPTAAEEFVTMREAVA
ncbi:MAG: glutathione-disulfide reductase [Betaproteobacteria bacterium RIFCSPLOWO2_02_FULL_64_12]|nr:MAG: glutathione-disulfide reductase [Betaproteobacteria bacterium RIFCSPLOWO2_02_FULL_64_12]